MPQLTGDEPLPGRSRTLWRDHDFGVFWAAQTLSVVGDSFALIALPLLVLHATGSVAQMGLLTGAAGAAAVVAGVFAGVVVDRLDRRKLLIACDLARLVLYALIPLVWAFGPQVWLLYVVLPLAEAVGMLFSVTYVTVVRALVPGDRITEANGRLNATAAAAGVVGPLLAGLVAAWVGPAAAVAVDAVSFGVSAACLSFVRFKGRAEPSGDATGQGQWRESMGKEFAAGVSFLRRHPVLRSLTVLLSVFSFLTLGLNDLIIYHLKHDLGQGDGAVGTVFAVGALGTVVGALCVARIRHRLGFGATWIGGVAVCGLALAAIGSAGSVAGIAALSAAFLGCVSVSGTCSMSLRQEVTPDHLLGRVTSAFWTIHYSAAPIGAAVLTWAAQRYGTGSVCLVAGACCLLTAALALFTPVRARRPEQAGPVVAGPVLSGPGQESARSGSCRDD
ncbi:MFS transporter [Streptomyces sp. BPTC-684]|uniref:MFS transporter n=1 Tax=Streptomyces sp. BPTC-684 TaxID=3043734 RepID=UPI0024B0E6E6|nr:MFS transporter [Streptomyces sp. BPTC-684]WHM40434.1 MFS transporter [Streptomyces sp. BPTC-684]